MSHTKYRAMEHPIEKDIEISRTFELLGGRKVLQRPVRNRLEAHDLLQDGLPGGVLDHLVKLVSILSVPHHGSLEKVVGISTRTYQRHKESSTKRLSPEQSGRTWKFAEILSRATELFGSQDEAEAWLERPAMALDQRRPIDLLSTTVGAESVEELLTRLEYGVYT
jgi:putative toxin-antitoxin system antitoxin component (TIGR02293 family)